MMPPKHESIRDLLARLNAPDRGWRLTDYWDADLCTIGIESIREPGRLVYISTWRKPPGVYYCDLELPPIGRDHVHTVAGRGTVATFDELLAILIAHLDAV